MEGVKKSRFEKPSVSKFLIEILGISIEILGFAFEILGISKICDNHIPCVTYLMYHTFQSNHTWRKHYVCIYVFLSLQKTTSPIWCKFPVLFLFLEKLLDCYQYSFRFDVICRVKERRATSIMLIFCWEEKVS